MKVLVVMSGDLEKMAESMMNGKVPNMWKKCSYPSLKPLGGYIGDLVDRLKFFETWSKNGAPKVFWMSAFFFTQAFLTGVRQNYARASKIPIDEIDFDFEFLKNDFQVLASPQRGAYINGLFFDGARWCDETQTITESYKDEVVSQAPTILFLPAKTTEFKDY